MVVMFGVVLLYLCSLVVDWLGCWLLLFGLVGVM